MAKKGITFDMGTIPVRNASLYPKIAAALTAYMTYEAGNIEGYMRANAPWTDQTSNARNGLMARFGSVTREKGARGGNGQFLKTGTSFAISLFHTVPYGIWLEVRWSGRYAIIQPTVQSYGPRVMAGAQGIIARI